MHANYAGHGLPDLHYTRSHTSLFVWLRMPTRDYVIVVASFTLGAHAQRGYGS